MNYSNNVRILSRLKCHQVAFTQESDEFLGFDVPDGLATRSVEGLPHSSFEA
jgi:hypothetical protein